MRKTAVFIFTLCVGLMLILNGCAANTATNSAGIGNGTNQNQQVELTPEQVAENHYKSMFNEDHDTFLECLGVIKNEKSTNLSQFNLPEEIKTESQKITLSGFKYEEFTGYDKEVAMASIAEDWLGKNFDFVYSVSEIEEIGRVIFTMSYQEEHMDQWICVVKTKDGWYTASIDLY